MGTPFRDEPQTQKDPENETIRTQLPTPENMSSQLWKTKKLEKLQCKVIDRRKNTSQTQKWAQKWVQLALGSELLTPLRAWEIESHVTGIWPPPTWGTSYSEFQFTSPSHYWKPPPTTKMPFNLPRIFQFTCTISIYFTRWYFNLPDYFNLPHALRFQLIFLPLRFHCLYNFNLPHALIFQFTCTISIYPARWYFNLPHARRFQFTWSAEISIYSSNVPIQFTRVHRRLLS